MQTKSLKAILSMPEMNHIIQYRDCWLVIKKFKELELPFVTLDYMHSYMNKTILEFVNSTAIPEEFYLKVIVVMLHAIWPDRFELLMDK